MDINAETILDALDEFERRPNEVSPVLEDYLLKIAKTGNIIFPWNKLKPLLKKKMELVLSEFCESCPPEKLPPLPNENSFDFDVLKSHILEALDLFPSAPFTIQRLCELVTDPKKHYNRTDKYMRGLQKNVLVVSTVNANTINQNEMNNNRNEPMVNGSVSAPSSPPCEEVIYDNENLSPNSTSPTSKMSVNGTVLDNFASVFPSAPCITSSSNVINVTDTHAFQNSDDDFDASQDVNVTSSNVTCELVNQDESQLEESPMDVCPVSSDDVENDAECTNEPPLITMQVGESPSMCSEVSESELGQKSILVAETPPEDDQISTSESDTLHTSHKDNETLLDSPAEASDVEPIVKSTVDLETNKSENVDKLPDQVTSSEEETKKDITKDEQIPQEGEISQSDSNTSNEQIPDSSSSDTKDEISATSCDELNQEMDIELPSTNEQMSNSENNDDTTSAT